MSIRSAIEDVDLFHKSIPDLIQDRGTHPPALIRRVMRWKLLKEEVEELEAAIMENDLVEVADAYADIIYIVLGSAIMHIGKDRFVRVWDEVQRSNMAKVVADGKMSMREDGKVLKPEGWTPPDIEGAFVAEETTVSEPDEHQPVCHGCGDPGGWASCPGCEERFCDECWLKSRHASECAGRSEYT
jgi:hypothetical protein